jgi:hypothetical protein
MPYLWGIDIGVAQLRASGLQKGELLKLLLMLPLRHLLGPTLRCKLILKEGDLPDKSFGILMSRGLTSSCSPHPLLTPSLVPPSQIGWPDLSHS